MPNPVPQNLNAAEEIALDKHPTVLKDIVFSYTDNDFPNLLATTPQHDSLGFLNRDFLTLEQSAIVAMFQEDQATFERIITSDPECIFKKIDSLAIECKHTWLQFQVIGETPFSIAQKFGWLERVKFMLPYYGRKLREAEVCGDKVKLAELEKMWILRMLTKKEQEALQNKYTHELILPMINALAADPTIQVSWVQNPETNLFDAKVQHANVATLKALKTLRDELFRPKTIDECIDVVQFLIAVYRSYDRYFKQRHAYRVWMVGLAQSLVGHDLAMIICQGADEVVDCQKPISERARAFLIEDGSTFYRQNRDGEGLGSTFLCSVFGGAARRPGMLEWWGEWDVGGGSLMPKYIEKLCLAKSVECDKLTQQVQRREGEIFRYTEKEHGLIQKLKALCEGPELSELDLSPFKDVLTDELLLIVLKKANIHLKKLTLDDCNKLTEKVPCLIAEHCPNIAYISTKSMPWKQWSTFGWIWSSIFSSLTELYIDGCVNLSYLYVFAPKLKPDNIAKAFYAIHKEKLKHRYNYFVINNKYFYKEDLLDLCLPLQPFSLFSQQKQTMQAKAPPPLTDFSSRIEYETLVNLSCFKKGA